MLPRDDPAEVYRSAERRLRTLLIGDGMYEPGMVKGEQNRSRVSTELRRMREAFYAAVAAGGGSGSTRDLADRPAGDEHTSS